MVHALLITPLAKGLFHRAVAQSANPLHNLMGLRGLAEQEAEGRTVMTHFGAESLTELRAMSAEALQEKASQYPGGGRFPGYPTALTLDGYIFTGTDLDVYKQGSQNDVPFLTGSVTGDADLFAGSEPVSLAQYQENATTEYGNKVPEFLALYPATNDDEATFMKNNVVVIHRMNMLIYTLAQARAIKGASATYMYYFTRPMPAGNGVSPYGAFHTADVPCITRADGSPEAWLRLIEKTPIGSMRTRGVAYQDYQSLLKEAQKHSPIPLLVPANMESGAAELRGYGTDFPWSMATGAANDEAPDED